MVKSSKLTPEVADIIMSYVPVSPSAGWYGMVNVDRVMCHAFRKEMFKIRRQMLDDVVHGLTHVVAARGAVMLLCDVQDLH